MLRSDVSMVAKSSTLWIHDTHTHTHTYIYRYESMTNVHGHEQYTVDPCDIYEVESISTRNTQWIHVKVDHSHE
jgi:hypothetical protein